MAVFLLVLFSLCGIAGSKKLTRRSSAPHYMIMAQGWLDGRLSLEGAPPGYCTKELRRAKKCRNHVHHDFALVHEIEFDDGSQARGFPCRTADCRRIRREENRDPWYVLGEGWTDFERGSVNRSERTWYVSFPPGPAVILAPFVAVFGLAVWDVLLTCFFAALTPAILVAFLDRRRGSEGERGTQHILIAVAWAFASPALTLGSNGSVWFTAQVLGALFLTLYLVFAWEVQRPLLAGLALGMAVACRPTMLFAVVFFAGEWWRGGRDLKRAAGFAATLGAIGLLLAWHNWARFADPFEFGHRFLDVRWQPRMQQYGLFSTHYLMRNLECLLWLMPQVSGESPFLRFSLHGSALWLTTPWLVAAPLAREAFAQRRELLVAAAAVAALPLLYQNSGQTQFTYRFAHDWLPMILLVFAFGGAAKRRALFGALVAVAAVVHLYGATMTARAPGQLFVTDPLGWPFEYELEEDV